MRVLVTGGAGFIGSHLVDALLAAGREVICVDSFDPFYSPALKRENVRPHSTDPAFTLVEADIAETDALARGVQGGCDAVVHLAARPGARDSIDDPLGFHRANAEGTLNVLEFARTREIRTVVFGSSSSVYGANPSVPWTEDDAVRPISPYASTKVSGELLGHVYSHLYGIRFLALRFFTVYGPRQRPDLAIHKFARKMLAGEPIPVFGDGTTRRDYTYVDDIVGGIRAALEYDDSPYEVINLGNNRTVSLREMIEGLEEALGVEARIERLPAQPGDVPQTWADVSKAERLLGYRPTTDFRDGLRSFAEWLMPRARAHRPPKEGA